SSSKRFRGTSKEALQRSAYRRGQQVMMTLKENYLDLEVILLQEGGYHWFISGLPEYELWIHFYDGLASEHNPRGIVIAAENAYKVTTKASLEKIYKEEWEMMALHSEDPVSGVSDAR